MTNADEQRRRLVAKGTAILQRAKRKPKPIDTRSISVRRAVLETLKANEKLEAERRST